MNNLEKRIVQTLRHEAEELPEPDEAHTLHLAKRDRAPLVRPSMVAPAALVAVLLLAAPVVWVSAGKGGSASAPPLTTASDQQDVSSPTTLSAQEDQPTEPSEAQETASAAEILVTTSGGNYDIELVKLSENATRVESDLRALGLDVSIDFVPVSPSLIGNLVATIDSSDTENIWEYIEPNDSGTSPILRIPTDFDGTLSLQVGRAAEDGEAFVSAATSALEPGEPLHCTDIEGMTVAEAAPIVAETGVTVEYYDANGDGVPLGEDEIPEDWYIVATSPMSNGTVQVELMPTFPQDGRTAEYLEYLGQGC